ncbi:response regulator [Dyella sp.]|jgi:DNA-binding response OmpR family regulator|uniref:response regulator n=1 Tax=Dyella sp. TaxID=1869338 RepID=UPI002D77EDE4|nr:response regulator [Dyella sp.]HET6433077.1 response regulator [Dyella sp.]
MSLEHLKGRRVLVAEDEYLIAEDISTGLQLRGAQVVGPFANVDDAVRACTTGPLPDAALLDINLGGQRVFPLARELLEASVPFVFTTGYDEVVVPAAFAHVRRLQKPIGMRALLDAINALLTPGAA